MLPLGRGGQAKGSEMMVKESTKLYPAKVSQILAELSTKPAEIADEKLAADYWLID